MIDIDIFLPWSSSFFCRSKLDASRREIEKLKAVRMPKGVEKQLWVLNKNWKIIRCWREASS
jgi:hypothetical protein